MALHRSVLELAEGPHRVRHAATRPYVHKLLTGRQARVPDPCASASAACPATRGRAESEHDIVENSHASTSLSYLPTGWPRRTRLRRAEDRPWRVVANHRRRRHLHLDRRARWPGRAAEQHRGRARLPAFLVIVMSTTTAALPTSRPSAAWPTTWPRSGSPSGTRTSSTTSRPPCPATPVVGAAGVRDAARASRRASRTSS